MFEPCQVTPDEKYAAEVARVGFMASAPFYAHYFYAEMQEVFTKDVPTAATDGRHIFINPEYLASLKPMERIFVYAHEVDHVISRHPQRMKHYLRENDIKGKPADMRQWNHATDYVINAGLIEQGVGMMNPDWLWDKDTAASDLAEDVYVRKYKGNPPDRGSTWGDGGKGQKGAKGDGTDGGGFDELLPPPVDPVTGKEDVPSDGEFKEAVARAAAAAKAMGKMPASLQRKVDEIMDPQVDWRDHVRMLMAGHLGANRETWDTLNRRYAALGALASTPVAQLPGRRGYGADTVAVVVDNSGSIGEKELSAFFAEVGGVLADVKPKRVVLIWCDAAVQQVDEARSLDELSDIRVKGSPGGGGTDFRPPFGYLEKEGIVPESLIYITDLYGSFPDKAPAYPVVWCASTDVEVPWGDVVRIKV